MSIEIVCPNGHSLKVKDRYAGKIGLCPKCQARIVVPELAASKFSEDAICELLGSPEPPRDNSLPVHQDPRHLDPGSSSDSVSIASASSVKHIPKKTCVKCEREILADYHICPHCHTYIAKLSEF
ncbi:MAG: hypothetical protein ACYC35_11885 [Pirellulales bacterium]